MRRPHLLSKLPFLVGAIALSVALLCVVVGRFTERSAINPWEPAIAMEAMRLLHGLPVYEPAHATHMYGPLLTAALAGIFALSGLNLLAARIVFSLCGVALAIVLAAALQRKTSRAGWLLFAALLFLGLALRTNLVFFSAQPDCAAMLLAVVGLCLWIKRSTAWWRGCLAISCIVCALLFKQTSAALALVPLAHLLLWRRESKITDWAAALVPAISILLTLVAIRVLWPQLFTGMVTVPASIKVNFERALPLTVYLLATFPLFLVGVLACLCGRRPLDERERWAWSAIAVLVPASVWTICKSGGSDNGFLPAYLAMTALFVLKIPDMIDWLASLEARKSLTMSAILSLAILFSFFAQWDRVLALLSARSGDENYSAAVDLARQSGIGTISPQDPTIAYRASGYFGRSLFFELDAHAVNGEWPEALPGSIRDELAHATHVIRANSYVPTAVFDRGLAEAHFYAVEDAASVGSAYELWSKAAK